VSASPENARGRYSPLTPDFMCATKAKHRTALINNTAFSPWSSLTHQPDDTFVGSIVEHAHIHPVPSQF